MDKLQRKIRLNQKVNKIKVIGDKAYSIRPFDTSVIH